MSMMAAGAATGAAGSMFAGLGALLHKNPMTLDPIWWGRHNTNAAVRTMPAQYGLTATYAPAYGALSSQQAYNQLFGTPGGISNVPFIQYDSDGNPYQTELATYVPETMGMLPMQRRAARYQAGTLGMVLPQYSAAIQSADPERARLYNALTAQANQDLASGGRLDPATLREVQQGVRSAQAARGMGFGPADVYTEAMQIGSAAEARRRAQQQAALSIYGAGSDLTQTATQLASNAGLGMMQGAFQYGMGSIPNIDLLSATLGKLGQKESNNQWSNALMMAGTTLAGTGSGMMAGSGGWGGGGDSGGGGAGYGSYGFGA